MSMSLAADPCARQLTTRRVVVVASVGALLAWAYWATFLDLAHRWSSDPQYSHGYLVPAFALFLLWHRRRYLSDVSFTLSGWGVALLAVATLVRLAGAFVFLPWLDAASLVICLAAGVVLVGGPRSLRWAWPALAFLLFMLPLPYRFQTALALPLQRVATQASTFLLQTAGLPALAEGNVILLKDTQVGVVEACNGLSMLVTFFALATAVTILLSRHWLHKA